MNWWAVVVAGVLAALGLGAAVWADSHSRLRRDRVLNGPPDRPLPGLPATAGAPTYIRPDLEPARPVTPLAEAARADLVARIDCATALEGGWARDRFVTDAPTAWAVLDSPVVLITPTVHAFRELWPALAAARQQDTGLVVAATDFDPVVLDTLVVNATRGTLRCVAVRCLDDNALTVMATITNGSVVSATSLQGGHLPPSALGACGTWVSSDTHSWALPPADSPTAAPEP